MAPNSPLPDATELAEARLGTRGTPITRPVTTDPECVVAVERAGTLLTDLATMSSSPSPRRSPRGSAPGTS